MKIQVQIENQTYEVEIEDLNARPILATVNGETVEVMPESAAVAAPAAAPAAQPAAAPKPAAPSPAAAPAAAPAAGASAVLAPIPGVIEEIMVREGDSVKNGQELLILEAMKMKNAIRATRDGKIARIHVSVGQQVPHSHVLIEFAD